MSALGDRRGGLELSPEAVEQAVRRARLSVARGFAPGWGLVLFALAWGVAIGATLILALMQGA